MKTVMVLSGGLSFIIRQARELEGYLERNFPDDGEREVWVLSDQVIDREWMVFSHRTAWVKSVKMCTGYIAEEYLEAIGILYEQSKPQLMLFGSDSFAAGLAVRSAWRCNGASCIGVKHHFLQAEGVYVEKAVYSHYLSAKLRLKKSPGCISIAKGNPEASELGRELLKVEQVNFTSALTLDWLRGHCSEQWVAPGGLASADLVVVVGKGVGSQENIVGFKELAERLGGTLGASRPVVMNAWLGMEHLVGASGAVISPDICLVVGASGAPALMAGIERSKIIIAVNSDENAPIFKQADVIVCSDYQGVIAELIQKLSAER